ncbi:helix-turn-helix transcriptional regulator [Rhabdobacter roseus]|uniref:helix-turn-helix domain-containing protein n=1 Tax=Rhabdobacter roseus TaxID=1655419 RepID=UPI0031B5B4BE
MESKIRSVAANIRKIREFRDYTQEYLAMKLGISQNAYSKIELAYTRLTLERLLQIAYILEVDTLDLIRCEGEELLQLRLRNDATSDSLCGLKPLVASQA